MVCNHCKKGNLTIKRFHDVRRNVVRKITSCDECGFWSCEDDVRMDIEVKFIKTHPQAILPTKNNETDTGYDVYSVDEVVIPPKSSVKISCGLKVGYITGGYWFEIRGRSGMAFKHSIIPFMGTIDNEYRGVLGLLLFNLSDEEYKISVGDRVCQMTIVPLLQSKVSFMEEEEMVGTNRGIKGFGDSGK